MMILHRANENPRVVGDRSGRDNEYMEYMKGEKETTGGTAWQREEERMFLSSIALLDLDGKHCKRPLWV